jgi:thiamine kinase-like enzyme
MKLGQASSEEERAIEHAIGRIAEWCDRPLRYQRINGGITNLNWKIQLEDVDTNFFMKLAGANTEIFIDRALAYEASVKAASTGYAPQVLHYLANDGIEVHEFLDDFRSCNVGDLLDEVIRGNIAIAYKEIHNTQQLSRTKTGFDQLHERLGQARSHRARLPRDLDQLLWQCGRAQHAVTAVGMSLCACFNDAYVTNYMVDAGRKVKIIDWEYASNNDPYWDLAMFSLESFQLGSEAMRELIEIHDGSYTTEAEARITVYNSVALVTWGLWAALQARISSVPFDFAKYSELLFLRARLGMLDPSWEYALTNL